MTELPKLERFDVRLETDGWYGTQYISRDYLKRGDHIDVADLVYWIQTHVREGSISTVYSDLLKALGEGDK